MLLTYWLSRRHRISRLLLLKFSRFTVPKKDSGLRPIINLKPLNNFLVTLHFKIENIQNLRDMLQPEDYMENLDLQDAYLTVPMDSRESKYLKFVWRDRAYKFTTLRFGLAPAPIVFTELLKPVVTF